MSLPKEIRELLDNVIDTLVKWDLIAYLQNKPSARTSAEEVASAIGRTTEEVIAALYALSKNKIVDYDYDGATIYYRYSPSKQWQGHIETFTKGLSDKNTRWLILNYLIEKNI